MKIAKKKMGRPVGSGKINVAIIDDICKKVRNGLTYQDAAILSGIAERTFHTWRAKGEKAKSGIYKHFSQSLKFAALESKNLHLNIIQKAAMGGEYVEEIWERDSKGEMVLSKRHKKVQKGDPKCSQWILERRHPDEFGQQVTVKGDIPVTAIHIVASDPLKKKIDDRNDNIMDAPEDNAEEV